MPLIKARSSSIMDSVDLRGQPTAETAAQATNTNQLASTAFVRTAIAELIDSSPELLNTLAELAAAINDDENFSTTITNSIATKVPLDGSVAMTGELTLSGAPTQNLSATTKLYVDQLVDAQMIYSTDDVPEGSNLYYTAARAKGAISLASDNTVVLDYDSSTGQFTYNHPTSDGVLEGSTNLYFSQARARQSISMNSDDGTIISYSSSTGEITFTTPDTDKIVEGSTNLYFTTARARASLSNGSNIAYDSGTGVISTQAAVWTVNGQEHDVVLDTDDITEGSTNLYFTNARGRSAVSLTTDDSNILSYSSGTGTFTFVTPSTDSIDEGSANLYYTNARVRAAVSASGDISYNDATGNFSYSTPTTDGVNEGSTNLYFQNDRARLAISLTSDNTDVLSYDSATGVFTFDLGNQNTDDVAEGTTNLYFTDARARSAVSLTSDWDIVSYNSSTGVFDVALPNTDDVGEGSTNQYFTTSRARTSVSATHSSGDGDFTYDNTTGVFDYVGPTSTEYRQAVSANHDSGHGNLEYSSSTGVFTYTGPTNTNYRNALSAVDAGGDGSFSYDSATGTFTYTGPSASETRVHISATTATGVTYDDSTGVIALASIPNSSLTNSSVTFNGVEVALGATGSFGTDSVTEEDNLYFTDGRARAAISLTSDNTSVLDYDSLTGEFTFSLGSQTTDDVAEGTNNLYFTNTRARDALSAVDAGGDGSFSYDSTTGAFTYTGPSASEVRAHLSATSASGVTYTSSTGVIALSGIPNSSLTNSDVTINGTTISLGGSGSIDTDAVTEGTTNLYYTQARFDSALAAKDTDDLTEGSNLYYTQARFDTALAAKDTDDLAEGSNLYFTTTRARDSLVAGTGVTYTAGTGTIAIGQAVGTTDNVTFNDVTVSGDLTVNGTLTTINSTDLTVTDKNITIAQGAANAAAADGAGITVDGANATITYASGDDTWNFNKSVSITGDLSMTGSMESTGGFTGDLTGNVTGNVTGDVTGDVTGTVSDISNHNTDDLAEGPTNQYFTEGRARGVLAATNTGTGHGSLSYNVGTGAFTFDKVTASNIRSELSASDAGGDGSFSYDSSTGTFTYTGPSASEARAHFSATSASGVSYDSSTGTFSLSSIPNSSLTNSDITINGTTVSLGGSNSFGTDSVTEEDNLYFTDARARNALSVTTSDSSVFDYNSTTGEFTFSLSGLDTSEVTEDPAATTSSGTMYFTNARARSAVSATDAGGDGSFSYDSATGTFTYTGPSASETRAHFGATKVSGDGNFSYDSATGVYSYTGPDDADYRLAISATKVSGDGTISYDDSTGVISYTGPSAADTRAHFSATSNTGITYTSATGVFALSAIPNGSLTNNTVTFNGVEVALGASGSFGTDSVTEEDNLYFTDARARSAVSLTTSDSTVFSYDSATGVFTYNASGLDTDEVTEGTTNLYFTQARARESISTSGWSNLSYNDATGVISISAPSTADVTEDVSNKYFTDARARQAISLTTDNTDAMSYDNTTGTFSFTLATVDTDEIAEGATNLYFTTTRARNTINNGSNIDYDASTGTISTQAAVWSVNGATHDVVLDTDNIDEGSANLYFTDARARSAITLTTDDSNILAYNSGTGALTFTTPTTDSIDEGSVNLYYTDTRADDRIAAASIRDLSDVDADDALQDGYTLVWSSSRGEFVPQNIAVTATTLNFTGDGTETSFSTGVNVTSIDNTQVYINGLIQAPTYSYTINTVSEVTSIVFDTAPEANDYIFIRVSSTSSLTAGGVLNEQSNIDGGTY